MNDESIADRSALHFADAVQRQFSFLNTSGFRVVRAVATLVQFESALLTINVYHGRQSFEIGLEICPIASPDEVYSLSELLRLIDPQLGENYRNYATRTAQGVIDGVGELAALFQRVLPVILRDQTLLVRLKLQHDELIKNYALKTQLLQARRRADLAWRSKDFIAFAAILAPLREVLEEFEIAKLEFAEKHLQRIK